MKFNILSFLITIATLNLQAQISESTSIDSLFSDWTAPNTPGCALGIMKNGELIYAKGYGLANMEYDIPNSGTSVFRIGSTSKQFTAACIVLLVEQKKLKLDQTLKSLFPEFPDYAEKITIKHLLNHTSGIRDYLQLAYLRGLSNDDYYTDADIMVWLKNQTELNFSPGEEFLYSNSGYWLLGQIVNKVSGMSMAQFSEKELFMPLNMSSTHFHNDHTEIVKNRASGYMPTGANSYAISMTTLDMIGDGGIFTTVEDIHKWDNAFYDSSVLSKEFWRMMTETGTLNNGESISYASGLVIGDYKGLKTISHGGAFVGFRAELLRFPEQEVSIAIFANRADANPSRMARQVAEIILKDKFQIPSENEELLSEAPEATEVTQEFELEQLVGDYEIQPGVVARLSINNDSLTVLQTWNQSTYTIIKTKGNSFQIPGDDSIVFTFSDLEEGYTQMLTVWQGGLETQAARALEIDLSNINLKDYEGEYYSSELDVTYTFQLENEELLMRIEDSRAMACSVSDKDQLSLEIGMAAFNRENSKVTGFTLDSGRVTNLKFVKSE